MKEDIYPQVPMSKLQRDVLSRLSTTRITKHSELLKPWPQRNRGALNMVIYSLRKKLGPHGLKIISHRGVGYSIVKEKQQAQT